MTAQVITLKQLQACCITPEGKARAEIYLPGIQRAQQSLLTTPIRLSYFLGQILHESGEFRYVEEIASGEAYQGRKDLGDIHPGDGVKFKGRGLIQITGLDAYTACGKALGLDLVNHPELLEQPEYAVASAVWFWRVNNLNDLADKHNYAAITRRINGGMNGWESRLMYEHKATLALQEAA